MADDNATIQQMREQIKELTRENKELSGYKTEVMESRRGTVAKELGFDSDLPKGLLTLHGDGEFTAEALRKTAEENGWNLPDPDATSGDGGDAGDGSLPQATQDRIVAQRSIDDARTTATPSQGGKVDFADWKAMAAADPREAMRVQQAGLVDIPGPVAQQLAANRNHNPLGR